MPRTTPIQIRLSDETLAMLDEAAKFLRQSHPEKPWERSAVARELLHLGWQYMHRKETGRLPAEPPGVATKSKRK